MSRERHIRVLHEMRGDLAYATRFAGKVAALDFAIAALSQPQAASSTQAGGFDWDAAHEALESMDDYARMSVGVAPHGPYAVLRDLLTKAKAWQEAASSTTPSSPCPTPSACRFHDECLAAATRAPGVDEAARVLADFAKTAPGRLPERVTKAIATVAALAQPAQQGEES